MGKWTKFALVLSPLFVVGPILLLVGLSVAIFAMQSGSDGGAACSGTAASVWPALAGASSLPAHGYALLFVFNPAQLFKRRNLGIAALVALFLLGGVLALVQSLSGGSKPANEPVPTEAPSDDASPAPFSVIKPEEVDGDSVEEADKDIRPNTPEEQKEHEQAGGDRPWHGTEPHDENEPGATGEAGQPPEGQS